MLNIGWIIEKHEYLIVSGENNVPRCIPICLFSKIICDSNGQSRYHCKRNHPRILSELHSFLYYGGNIDTRRLLVNRKGYDTCTTKKNDSEHLFIKLNIHGCTRFEQYTASPLLDDHVTKYDIKRSLNSDNLTVLFQSIVKYYTDSGNYDKSAMSIYGKYMYEIIKLESKTQDECIYLLSGGHISTHTVQTRKISMNKIDLK